MASFSRLAVVALLTISSLFAGVYQYPISGNTGNPKDETILVVDTNSDDFKNRATWISERAGLLLPKIRDMVNFGPGVAGGNPTSEVSITIWGQACWTKNEQEACIDVRAIATGSEGPMHSLAWLNLTLGLGRDQGAITHLRYASPKPLGPAKDWESPDSPLGEMFGEPAATKFRSKHLGNKEGDRWTGPSGAVYEFKNIGGVFRFVAWVRQ